MTRTVFAGIVAGLGGTLLGMQYLPSYPSDSSLTSSASDSSISASSSHTTLEGSEWADPASGRHELEEILIICDCGNPYERMTSACCCKDGKAVLCSKAALSVEYVPGAENASDAKGDYDRDAAMARPATHLVYGPSLEPPPLEVIAFKHAEERSDVTLPNDMGSARTDPISGQHDSRSADSLRLSSQDIPRCKCNPGEILETHLYLNSSGKTELYPHVPQLCQDSKGKLFCYDSCLEKPLSLCGVVAQNAFYAKSDDGDALSITVGSISANGAKDIAGVGMHNMSGRPLTPRAETLERQHQLQSQSITKSTIAEGSEGGKELTLASSLEKAANMHWQAMLRLRKDTIRKD